MQHTNCLSSTAAHILSWVLQQEYQGCTGQRVRGGMGGQEEEGYRGGRSKK